MFLESLDERPSARAEFHLLTDAGSLTENERVRHWIDRHPRFHLVSSSVGRSISQAVREWLEAAKSFAGLPNLPKLEQCLGTFIQGATLQGRPFAWTRTGVISHWRAPLFDNPLSGSS